MYPWYTSEALHFKGENMGTEKESDAPEPKPDTWAWLDAIEKPVDEDFLEAVSEKQGEQRREELEDL